MQTDSDGLKITRFLTFFLLVLLIGTLIFAASPFTVEEEVTFKIKSAIGGYASNFTYIDQFQAGANQGVATNGTHFWATNAYGTGTYTLYLYNSSGAEIDSHADAHLDGTNMAQINSLLYYDGKIYAGANNYDTEPRQGYIKVYWADNLTYIEEHYVGAYWCEGPSYNNGYFWTVGDHYDNNTYSKIDQFYSNWTKKATYDLTYSSTGLKGGAAGYQGSAWLNGYIYCPLHDSATPDKVDIYYWNGSGFEETTRVDYVNAYCHQGLYVDPNNSSVMWWAERHQGATCYITNSTIDNNVYSQFALGGNLEFYKIKITETSLWLNKSYSFKKQTGFKIQSYSTWDTQFKINSWFNTANSSAELYITSPLSEDINFTVYSPNFVTASVTGAKSYTYTSGGSGSLEIIGNSDISRTITISATYTETTVNEYTPENIGVVITDMEGCGNWVFSEEAYYTFRARYWDGDGYADLDVLKMRFSDGVNTITAVYDTVEEEYFLETGSDFANIKDGTLTIMGDNSLQVTFPIYLKNTIIDANDVDIYMWCNDTSSENTGWQLKAQDYFNIYNLGGMSTLTVVGDDAGRIKGGDVFDLYAYSNSSVEATAIFRNLQHIKLLPTIGQFLGTGLYEESRTNETLLVKYFVDYCLEGSDDFIEGWAIEIKYVWGSVGGTSVYMKYNVSIYERGEYLKSRTTSCYVATQNYYNMTVRWWIDLWFNRINASSTWGARVNAYYFPMTDTSNEWLRWLTGSNWGIDETKEKEFITMGTLKDANGATIYTKQIELVRIGCNVTAVNRTFSPTPNYLEASNYDVLDLTFCPTNIAFEGIQTPVFDETKVPIMPQGGFLGAIVSALQRVGQYIATALGPQLLGFWNSFVDFLDSIAASAGYPGFFRALFTTLGNLWSWFVDSMGYFVTFAGTAFTFIFAFITKLLNMLSGMVTQWVSMISAFFSFLDGTYTAGVNVYNDLGISWWIILGAILYPVYLLLKWDEEGIDAVINHVRMVLDVLSWIGNLFLTVIRLFLNVIGRIIESIPVIE